MTNNEKDLSDKSVSQNREIKFKGRHKQRKEMYDCVRVTLPANGRITFGHFIKEDGEIEEIESKDIIIIEYTGLKDKNGVEIYEGDILAFETTRYIDRGEHEDGLFEKEYGINTLKINTYKGDIRDIIYKDEEYKKHIEYKDEKIVKGYQIDRKSIVTYDRFGFEPFISNEDSEWGGGHGNNDCIVVGNIYQNPELLSDI